MEGISSAIHAQAIPVAILMTHIREFGCVHHLLDTLFNNYYSIIND